MTTTSKGACPEPPTPGQTRCGFPRVPAHDDPESVRFSPPSKAIAVARD